MGWTKFAVFAITVNLEHIVSSPLYVQTTGTNVLIRLVKINLALVVILWFKFGRRFYQIIRMPAFQVHIANTREGFEWLERGTERRPCTDRRQQHMIDKEYKRSSSD